MNTRTITLPADQWEAILDAVVCHWDEGPPGEGWKSDRLSAASAALSTLLSQPETHPAEVAGAAYMEAFRLGRAAGISDSRLTIKPVPVSERLPGPENCTTDKECWYWDSISGCWFFLPGPPLNDHYTHWLPHHALPLPQQPS